MCFVNRKSSKSEEKFLTFGLGIPHFRIGTYSRRNICLRRVLPAFEKAAGRRAKLLILGSAQTRPRRWQGKGAVAPFPNGQG